MSRRLSGREALSTIDKSAGQLRGLIREVDGRIQQTSAELLELRKAAVKVRSSEGQQVPIDELGPGELLGWGAVMEPHVYTASAWTTEPSEAIVVPGAELRELCDANKHIGYQVAKGIGEVMSRRFGQAVGGRGGQVAEEREAGQLRQFSIFSELDDVDLELVGRIAEAIRVDGVVEAMPGLFLARAGAP